LSHSAIGRTCRMSLLDRQLDSPKDEALKQTSCRNRPINRSPPRTSSRAARVFEYPRVIGDQIDIAPFRRPTPIGCGPAGRKIDYAEGADAPAHSPAGRAQRLRRRAAMRHCCQPWLLPVREAFRFCADCAPVAYAGYPPSHREKIISNIAGRSVLPHELGLSAQSLRPSRFVAIEGQRLAHDERPWLRNVRPGCGPPALPHADPSLPGRGRASPAHLASKRSRKRRCGGTSSVDAVLNQSSRSLVCLADATIVGRRPRPRAMPSGTPSRGIATGDARYARIRHTESTSSVGPTPRPGFQQTSDLRSRASDAGLSGSAADEHDLGLRPALPAAALPASARTSTPV